MKTKIKRHSRSVISVILAISMLVSCMMVGLIATDAANVTDEESLGDTTYYLWWSTEGGNYSSFKTDNRATMTESGGTWSGSFSHTGNGNFYFIVNTSSTSAQNGDVITKDFEGITVTNGNSAVFNNSFAQECWNGTALYSVGSSMKNGGGTVYVTYNPTTKTVTFSDTGSGGSTEPTTEETTSASEETTTDTGTKSTKTLIISYDKQNNRNYTHVWYDGEGAYIDGTKAAGAMTDSFSDTGVTGLYYKDITDATNSTTKQIDFLCKEGTDWSSYQSGDVKKASFKKGKQWYLYNSAASGDYSDEDDEYTPLEIKNVVRPSVVEKGKNNSFTVSVDGGVPKFVSDKDTTANYTLKVGTTDGGSEVLSSTTTAYSSEGSNFTFDWNPNSTGTVTLYFELSDGIDTVKLTKTYTVKALHDVSISAGEGGTVSPSGTVKVDESSSTTVTANANDGYDFSGWTFGDGITHSESGNTATITTNSSGTYTVQANFTKKPVYKVTAKANNSDYGSATASVGAAYQGQTVTVTYAENTGTYNNYTVVDSEGATVASSISGNTITFTMPAKPVTITVNFTEYTGTSDYYYNGYNKDTFAQISGKYAQRMSKGKINGVEYSYYHVQNRTEVDQTFTVSYGNLDYDVSGTDKLMYFTRPGNWGDSVWSNWATQYAMFYSNDGQIIQDWTGMDGYREESDNRYTMSTAIPDGARYARVKDGKSQKQTVLIDLNTSKNNGNNAFYLDGGMDGNDYKVTGWKEGTSVIGDVFEYFKGSGNYTADFDTAGFNSHNINIKVNDISVTHSVAKPNGLSEAYRNDYYILVFHPSTTYNYNGVEGTIGTNPIILWSPTKPGETNNNATVYAKDGTLRNNSTSNNITSVYETYALHATTTIKVGDSSEGTRHDDKYTVYTHEKDNTQITVTTTIDSGDWRNNYYVKGFSVNGVTPALYEYKSDGTYSVTLTLGEDKILYDGGEIDYVNGKYVEITPIYYAKTPGDTVTFYVRGFDEEVASSWGNTVAAYPFYNSTYAGENALGGYPGQPMINYGGKLYIDVPLKASNNQSIQGITLNNYYWDRIHGTTDNEGNFQHIRAVSTHAQTYDFDDFSKIYYENIGDEPDFIYFDFKYETEKNNEKSDTKSADSSYNTFEDLVDAQGQKTDIFGTVLEGADLDKAPIYVVSDGYFNTFAGAYATQWHVYENDGSFIGTIAPSIRWVKDVANLNTTKYPYTSTKYKDGQYYPITDYTDEYTALQAYVNTPVKISYDMEIRNEAGQTGWDTPSDTKHNSNADDKAKRSDGIWMYSYTGVKINAYTKVEISTDDGKTYNVDPYISGNKTANELAAYFTNEDFNGETSVTTRSSASDKFTFNAESAGEFIFVGWYLLDNGKYFPISKNTAASSDMDSGATFVARFIKNPSGTLTLSHSVLKEASYMGDADTYIGIEVVDTSNNNTVIYRVVDTDKKSEITLNNTYVKYNHGYKVNVKLYTTPKLDDTFARYQTGAMDTSVFFDYTTTYETPTRISEFSFNIDDLFEYDSENTQYVQNTKTLRYYSQLNKIEYTYSITYDYTPYRHGDRGLGQKQQYIVNGTFTASDIDKYLEWSEKVPDNDNDNALVGAYSINDADKRKAFIEKYGPYENNFLTKISWNTNINGTNAMQVVYHGKSRHYDIDVSETSDKNEKITVQLYLPYNHSTAKSDNYDAIMTDGKYTYDDSTQPMTFDNIDQMSWFTTNGSKSYEEGDPKFVKAPDVVYNGENPLVFRYWRVYKLENVTTNTEKVEYTRCFNNEFNLSLYQDSYIEAYYSEPTQAEIDSEKYTSPHDLAKSYGMGATITFMENSRNQYNNFRNAGEKTESRKKQGDRIFTDFLISFANPQDTQYATYANGTYYAGVVVERVALLDKNQKGDYYTLTEEQYKAKYGSEVNADKLSDIEAFIENTGTYAESGTVFRDGNEKYDTNAQGVIKYQKSQVDANTLDNKNRMDFWYSFSVRNHTDDFAYNHNADYVYRAYSYIKDNSGNVVMLSEKPLYFTFYDMGSIQNAAEGYTYDNP